MKSRDEVSATVGDLTQDIRQCKGSCESKPEVVTCGSHSSGEAVFSWRFEPLFYTKKSCVSRLNYFNISLLKLRIYIS